MPFFTAVGVALFGAGTFLASATAAVLGVAASYALGFVQKALAGTPDSTATDTAHFSVQGKLTAGGDVPRSMALGYCSTAGSLVYANTWGEDAGTPNAYFTQVIALSDMPVSGLREMWVNGTLCTVNTAGGGEFGWPVVEYNKDGKDHLWVKFHDGTQTTGDTFLSTRVASADRPWNLQRVGYGVAYVAVTALVDDTLFTGFPSFKWAVDGAKLYDPSKDSTNGGAGSHRFSDPSTWGGDGDHLPVVQIYNLFRGIGYAGSWFYGLQGMNATRVPSANWISQIDKCRATIQGTSGLEPTYRSGAELKVSARLADAVEGILASANGRIAEIGGFYKIHVGAPDAAVATFTDDEILSSEEQTFTPFQSLANSINGISARYPSPEQGWATTTAPPLYDEDFEAEDGNRRLLSDVSFDFVPYDAQVQRIMLAALQEARRARQHIITLPPEYWLVEPGDVLSWSSARNGYDGKLFRVDAMMDKANLDVMVTITEVDPNDYNWDHDHDYTPPNQGGTNYPRPEPQGIVAWFAEGAIITDGANPRRPAIRLAWDGTLAGIVGVQWEVRLKSDATVVNVGRTDQMESGSVLISQNLLPKVTYEARGQYLPSAPRDMLWSDWLTVTTPDVRFTLADFDDSVVSLVDNVEDSDAAEIKEALETISAYVANQDARNWADQQRVRTQLEARTAGTRAAIEEIREVAVSTEVALANYQQTVTATFGTVNASISTQSTAIARLDGYAAAAWSVTLDVNNYVTGISLVNGGAGVSAFVVTVDKFQVAAPGVAGGAPTNIFTVANVNGAAKVAIRGDVIVDGSITTQKLNVGTLSAITANLGSITAGYMQSPSGLFVIDLNNSRILILGN